VQDTPPLGLPPASQVYQSSVTSEDVDVFGFDLSRYFKALRRYVWLLLAFVALAVTAAVLYTQRQTKIYQATASVQIDPRNADLLGQGQEMMSTAATGTLDYYKQQLKVLSSFSLIKRTVERGNFAERILTDKQRAELKPEAQLDAATRILQEYLTVGYPEQNRTMYITVRSPTPQDAADIANEHIRTYEAAARGLISLDSQKASDALATEFAQADKALRDAETTLNEFQDANDLTGVSLEDKQTIATANVASFQQKYNDAHAERIKLGSRLAKIRIASMQEVLESPLLTIAEVSSFDVLRAQFYTERNALKAMSKDIGNKTIEYQKQKEKVDDLLGALQTENKRQVAGAEASYQAAYSAEIQLKAEVDRYLKEAKALPKDKYSELLRNRKKADDNYNILVARLSASQMSGRMNKDINTNVRPLDPALVPTIPVSPSLKVNIAAASVGSILIGLALIMLAVFLDRSIKSVEDAQNSTGVPVLGVIPVLAESDLPRDDDKARDLYVHEHPTSRVAECCRSLRTNIMFSAADRKLKTMVVSSANPREGKTTSVIYLGTTLAQSGQRVLLIDTDMRRPRLHSSTGVTRNTGLSNLILGDENYDEVIRKTDIPNLFVLPCGPLPPNPAELLMTKRFSVVLEELAKRFDRVILDSPPLQAVTDAVVLSKQVDGVILVVRAGKTLREEIKRSSKQIRDVGGSIFGVIVNELDTSDRNGYYYSYYGYGPDPKELAKDDASKAS
jgi:polysaccharide biosynthesis transport protein